MQNSIGFDLARLSKTEHHRLTVAGKCLLYAKAAGCRSDELAEFKKK